MLMEEPVCEIGNDLCFYCSRLVQSFNKLLIDIWYEEFIRRNCPLLLMAACNRISARDLGEMSITIPPMIQTSGEMRFVSGYCTYIYIL